MATFRDSQYGRLVALALAFVLALATLAPHLAQAKVEYVNGSGSAEGDPGDGLGAVGGGSGGSDILDDSFANPSSRSVPIPYDCLIVVSSMGTSSFYVGTLIVGLRLFDLVSWNEIESADLGGTK